MVRSPAVVCAIAAGVELAPVADYVTRTSSEGPAHQWTPVAIFVWIVLCIIAGVAGYLLIRTIGWWVLWRQARDYELEGSYETEPEGYSGTDWEFPEAPGADLQDAAAETGTTESAAAEGTLSDRTLSGRRRPPRRRHRRAT